MLFHDPVKRNEYMRVYRERPELPPEDIHHPIKDCEAWDYIEKFERFLALKGARRRSNYISRMYKELGLNKECYPILTCYEVFLTPDMISKVFAWVEKGNKPDSFLLTAIYPVLQKAFGPEGGIINPGPWLDPSTNRDMALKYGFLIKRGKKFRNFFTLHVVYALQKKAIVECLKLEPIPFRERGEKFLRKLRRKGSRGWDELIVVGLEDEKEDIGFLARVVFRKGYWKIPEKPPYSETFMVYGPEGKHAGFVSPFERFCKENGYEELLETKGKEGYIFEEYKPDPFAWEDVLTESEVSTMN